MSVITIKCPGYKYGGGPNQRLSCCEGHLSDGSGLCPVCLGTGKICDLLAVLSEPGTPDVVVISGAVVLARDLAAARIVFEPGSSVDLNGHRITGKIEGIAGLVSVASGKTVIAGRP